MTTKTQHTPGPWVIKPAKDRGFWVCVGPSHCPTESLRFGFMGGSPVQQIEDEANARLVSAAPELLEACEKLLALGSFAKHGSDAEAAAQLARAAIAKATGEKP